MILATFTLGSLLPRQTNNVITYRRNSYFAELTELVDVQFNMQIEKGGC